MVEGWRMWAISLLTILLLLPLLSAAPLDIAGGVKKVDVKTDNDGMHSHDENVTRGGKLFGHNQFLIGNDMSVNVEGDDASIGHNIDIDVHVHSHDHHHHEADSVIECKEGLRELFKSIDSNKNGLVDAKELLRVCHQNNLHITESLAVRILTLPDKTVGFNLAKFCELLKDCPSTNSADLIYFLLQLFDKDIDGGWSNWSEYGQCSKNCGGGQQTRTRTCTNPVPQHKGRTCVGDPTETKDCNLHHCEVDGGWSNWSEYGLCSKNCGGGQQTRMRTCTNPVPQHKDRTCVGYPTETKDCNLHHCDRLLKGQKLLREEFLRSQNGEYDLVMQSDGNLVIYVNFNNGRTPTYSTKTFGGSYLVFQDDGNLVIYKEDRAVLWATNILSQSADSLVMQNDGNLVLYAADNALWASNTVTCRYKDDLSSVLLENNWRTQNQIDVMPDEDKRNTVIVEVEQMTGHTIADLQGRPNVRNLGSLTAIANMAAILIKYSIRSSSDVKTMTYEPDLRNTLIVEASQRFSIQISQLQSMTDPQLLKTFCTGTSLEHLNAGMHKNDGNLKAIEELTEAFQDIMDGLKALSSVRDPKSADKLSSDETSLLELVDRVTKLVEKCENDDNCEKDKIIASTQEITKTFNKLIESGTVSSMFQNSFAEKKEKLYTAISGAEKIKAFSDLANAINQVTCPYKDDLSSVLLENNWSTQNQINDMSDFKKRDMVIAKVEQMTGHTTEDLRGRENAGEFGSLAAIANMAAILIKYFKSSSDVKTMKYEPDLRNAIIRETNQRFSIKVSQLQGMTDHQLLKTFCTASCMVHVGTSRSNTISTTVWENCVCPSVVKKGNWFGDDAYPDEFKVTQDGSSLQVQRTDSNTGWGMDLSFKCIKGSCKVHVGKSDLNTISATVSEGCICPTVVNKGNWLGYGTHMEEFKVTQDGSSLQVQRTDSNTGWKMDLSFKCIRGNSDVPALELKCPSGDVFTSKQSLIATRMEQNCWACHREVDGCSVPELFSNYKEKFNKNWRASCNIHDLCYTYLGRSREECDDEWLHNMLRQCGKSSECQSLATRARELFRNFIVSFFADGAYEKAQKVAKTCFLT